MPRFDPATVTELNRVGLLAELPGEVLSKLAGRMERQDIEPGSPVVLEGEEGQPLLLRASRASWPCPTRAASAPKRVLRPGDYFGEVALAMDVPRTASVTALTAVDGRELRPRDLRRVRQAALRRPGLAALDEREDAFGRMLLDLLEGRRAHEVIERSDGHIDVAAGPKAYFEPFRRWLRRRATGDAVRARAGARRRRQAPDGSRSTCRSGATRSSASTIRRWPSRSRRRRGVKDARLVPFEEIGPRARRLRHGRDDVQQLRPLRQRRRCEADAQATPAPDRG